MKQNVKKLFFRLLVPLLICSGCWHSVRSDVSFDLSKVTFDEHTYPVVILGGGVVGLSAALYCGQANVPCLVVEGSSGSALAQSHAVRNWPGVMQDFGSTIIKSMRDQVLSSNNVVLVNQDVVEVDFSGWPYQVKTKTNNGQQFVFKALSVIVGMGSTAHKLGVEGENDYWGHGVGNCALCDGFLYKNKVVGVVGGGDSAVEEASYLADIASKVYIFIRSNVFAAKDKQALNRLLKRPNIEVLYKTKIKKIVGDGTKVTHVVVENDEQQGQERLLEGVFLAIGSRPNSEIFKGKLDLDQQGFIVLNNFQKTSVQGVYAAGDISDKEFVQAYTAGGDGYKAAMQAGKFLKDLGFELSMVKVSLPTRAVSFSDGENLPKQEDKKEESHDAIQEIKTMSDFEKLVKNINEPIVIDVFATLCIPCQKMMPIVHELAEKYENKITFLKINISNKNIDLQACLSNIFAQTVDSVPTFIFVKNGKEAGRLNGFNEADVFEASMNKIFNIKTDKD